MRPTISRLRLRLHLHLRLRLRLHLRPLLHLHLFLRPLLHLFLRPLLHLHLHLHLFLRPRPLLHLFLRPLLLGLLLAPRGAAAVDLRLPGQERSLSLQLTETFLTEYHHDSDALDGKSGERYIDFKNRTDLLLLHGSTALNVRFDFDLFANTNESSLHQNHVALEKISLATIQRSFDATAGDFHVRIGRGLALDLTRVAELFRDTTLRGAELRVRTRYVNGQAFGGWVNPLDVDDFADVARRIPSDVIGGARIEVRPRDGLQLAIHYVGGSLQSQTATSRNATNTIGASVELPNLARRLALYGEFDYMSRTAGLQLARGHGTYLSATGNFGPLAALLEFKLYSQLRLLNDFGSDINTFVYNRPPTLTRSRAEVLNNHDVIGPRLKLDLRVGPYGTVISANYGFFFYSDARPGDDFFTNGSSSHDAYVGIQQALPGGALDLSGGYRVDWRDQAGQKVTDYSCGFFEAELSLAVHRNHTLELEAEYRNIVKGVISYWDLYVVVGYRPNKWVAGGFSYEHSTELKALDPNDSTHVRSHYGGVRATVNFTPTTFARIFGGTTRGGMRCIDGFCRELPPFIGFRVELVAQF